MKHTIVSSLVLAFVALSGSAFAQTPTPVAPSAPGAAVKADAVKPLAVPVAAPAVVAPAKPEVVHHVAAAPVPAKPEAAKATVAPVKPDAAKPVKQEHRHPGHPRDHGHRAHHHAGK
jgi:hypothetical protein